MKIWESIIYGIITGLCELLPISFQGHSAILGNVLHLSPLNSGSGYYIRWMLCLGAATAILLSYRKEVRIMNRELLYMIGLKRYRRHQKKNMLLRRSIFLGAAALLPMLVSLFFLSKAEGMGHLLVTALLFVFNGILITYCCKGKDGTATERNASLFDGLLIGIGRMISVFPGLSSFGASVAIGRARGYAQEYNLRFSYLLTYVFQVILSVYFFVRSLLYGQFAWSLLIPMVIAFTVSTAMGYLAIQYFRYLMKKNKLKIFAYYCWEAAAVAVILALINA